MFIDIHNLLCKKNQNKGLLPILLIKKWLGKSQKTFFKTKTRIQNLEPGFQVLKYYLFYYSLAANFLVLNGSKFHKDQEQAYKC